MTIRIFMLGDRGPYTYDDSKTYKGGTPFVYFPTIGSISFVDSSPPVITDSDEGFISAGFSDGDIIKVEGTGANDGIYHVIAAEADSLTLHTSASLVDETPSKQVKISAPAVSILQVDQSVGFVGEDRPPIRYLYMFGGDFL